jgi:hypothetical protein
MACLQSQRDGIKYYSYSREQPLSPVPCRPHGLFLNSPGNQQHQSRKNARSDRGSGLLPVATTQIDRCRPTYLRARRPALIPANAQLPFEEVAELVRTQTGQLVLRPPSLRQFSPTLAAQHMPSSRSPRHQEVVPSIEKTTGAESYVRPPTTSKQRRASPPLKKRKYSAMLADEEREMEHRARADTPHLSEVGESGPLAATLLGFRKAHHQSYERQSVSPRSIP